MSAPTSAAWRLLYPEFDDPVVSDLELSVALKKATRPYNATAWGSLHDEIIGAQVAYDFAGLKGLPTAAYFRSIENLKAQKAAPLSQTADLASEAALIDAALDQTGALAAADLATEVKALLASGDLAVFKKPTVRVATTGDITLEDEQTIDDIAVAEDDLVAVVAQTNPAENGIYRCVAAVVEPEDPGAWVRIAELDDADDFVPGVWTYVTEGTANAGTIFVLVTDGPIVVDTTELTFVQVVPD